MIVDYEMDPDRARLAVLPRPELFDGDPGLDRIFFDGVNEPIAAEVLTLAAWIMLSPCVSRRFISRKPVVRPLVNQIVKQWGAAIEVGPAEEKPRAFPQRAGSLVVEPAGNKAPEDAPAAAGNPVYTLKIASLSASGTVFEGGVIRAKSNARLLGNGVSNREFPSLIATALVYADFLGIADIWVHRTEIDAFAPRKVAVEPDPVPGWRELLKHAGFNLRVRD